MHRTVPKTLLHSSLATGTSNGDPVVQQKKKGPKTAVFDPENGPFWTPDSGPRVPPDTQNQKIFKPCHDSWQLCLQRRQPAKKWKEMVRPLIFLKGPRSLCEHIFGQFSLEMLFFVHLQHVLHLGGVKCRTYRGSVQKTAFWVLLQRNFFFNQNRNTHQLHQIRTLNKKKKCEK